MEWFNGLWLLSVDLILKSLPVNVALVAAIIAFGNFVPKVWEMVEKPARQPAT